MVEQPRPVFEGAKDWRAVRSAMTRPSARGDTAALAVHVDGASDRGYTPVAVRFDCRIDRRTRARIRHDGGVGRFG
jgi:fumarate hydratase subunit alpha